MTAVIGTVATRPPTAPLSNNVPFMLVDRGKRCTAWRKSRGPRLRARNKLFRACYRLADCASAARSICFQRGTSIRQQTLTFGPRSEEHTSELQSQSNLV